MVVRKAELTWVTLLAALLAIRSAYSIRVFGLSSLDLASLSLHVETTYSIRVVPSLQQRLGNFLRSHVPI